MQSTRSKKKRQGGVGTTIALLLLGTLLLAGVAMYCYTRLVPHIESDLTERVSSALTSAGLTTVQTRVTGTDVTLSGTTDSAANARAAEQVAQKVYGVTRVHNEINGQQNNSVNNDSAVNDVSEGATTATFTEDSDEDSTGGVNSGTVSQSGIEQPNAGIPVAPVTDGSSENSTTTDDQQNSSTTTNEQTGTRTESAIHSPFLDVEVRENRAQLGGILPNTSMVQRVIDTVVDQYGSDNVENQISIVPEAQDPSWLSGAIEIISRIDNITNPSFKIGKNEASLEGEVSSETLGAQQLSAAKRALGNDIEVSATFSIIPLASELPAPEKKERETKKRPASLRIESKDDSVRLTGTVSNIEEADSLRVDLADLFENTDLTDELIIDDSVASADWLSEALSVTSNVKDIDNFSVSINSGQMMLSGDVASRERGETLAATAVNLTDRKLTVVNNFSVNQAELVIESREEVLARELRQKLGTLDTTKIVFNPGSAILADEAMEVLDAVAVTISSFPDQTVEISGHTDTSGDSVNNLELSKKRAFSVRDYLVSKGLPGNQLRPIGYGESKPVADNSTPAGRAANRRIEFNL